MYGLLALRAADADDRARVELVGPRTERRRWVLCPLGGGDIHAAEAPALPSAVVAEVLVERAGVAAAGRAVFRVEVRVPRPARVQIKVHGAFAQNRRVDFHAIEASWPALVGLCTDRGRVAGRRLVVSEGVRGRGGDREEEAYSASRHLRRTQSGPAAGAGSRAKRDGVGLPSRSVGGPTRGPTRRLFWASILFASVLHAASYGFCCCAQVVLDFGQRALRASDLQL